jgi:PAS domain S-box-containing protein
MTAPAPLHILFVEDAAADAELEERHLRGSGLEFVARRVETREAFVTALREFQPQLVLADYSLPRFNGMEALALAREQAPLAPVIIVTGSINEETAVECMKAGAVDYVLKGHLARLVPAVQSALERRRIILDRIRAEETLRASERKHRAIFEEARDAIFIADAATQALLEANASTLALVGLSAEQARGAAVLSVVAPEYVEAARNALEVTARGGSLGPVEMEVLRPDGSRVPVEIRASRFVDTSGRLCLVGVARDISERRRSTEERTLLGAALEQAAEIAVITDTAGTIQYVNPAFERVTGYSREEAIGQNPRILKSGMQDADIYRRLWDTLTSGGVFTGTFVNRKKNGDHYVAEVLVSPVRDASGHLTHYVGLQRDVTHEHDLQEQLRQAQKMEAVGMLAGGIAHDFNNLLSVILTNAALLKDDLPAGSPGQSCLADLVEATHQGSSMVKKLLAFSRRERLSPTAVRVGPALNDIARTLRRLLPETIVIRVEADTTDLTTMVDPGALEQIVLNLATNARDAMPRGGSLTLRLSEVVLGKDDNPLVLAFDQPGRYACVAVSDSGAGMDEATLARAFEPFFTTKSPGTGTGLGLAMVFGVMRQHRGFVHLYSELAKGTTVRLYFPVSAGQKAEPARAAPQYPRGTETILVVEDQQMLRRATAQALTKLGYTVLLATDGEQGLRTFAEHKDEIALVLSDLVMPKLDGLGMLQRLRADGPVRCLLMSGYPAGTEGTTPVPSDIPSLEKPWTVEKLARKVRDILDKP